MGIKELRDEVLALTEEWYSYVGKDHHKDRDCHFEIVQDWAYGQPPTYRVQHWGYVDTDWALPAHRQFDNYPAALLALRTKLVEMLDDHQSRTYE